MVLADFVKSKRLERNMDHRALAEASHVARVTIHRVETSKGEPTFLTAVRLAKGLHISINEFSEEFGVELNYVPNFVFREKSSGLEISDVFDFLRSWFPNWEGARAYLAAAFNPSWLSQVQGQSPRRAPGRPPTPITDFTKGIPYPPETQKDQLRSLATNGGVLIFPDLGPYLRNSRTQSGLALQDLKKGFDLDFSTTELIRAETGDMDSIKFQDVLKFQKFLQSEHSFMTDDGGLFWEVCWKGASFLDDLEYFVTTELGAGYRFTHKEIREIAYSFVILNRWRMVMSYRGE